MHCICTQDMISPVARVSRLLCLPAAPVELIALLDRNLCAKLNTNNMTYKYEVYSCYCNLQP